MKDKFKDTLRQELRASGASAVEADQLLGVAGKLRSLKAAPAAGQKPTRPAFRLSLLPVMSIAVVMLMVGMSLVALSQTSMPGNTLYSVKRLSEKTAVAVQPNYRGTLMMRRAQEVQQLVASGANTHTVLATLADYKVEASAYKSRNYPTLEYCKDNLQRAATVANPTEKQVIVALLKNLGNIN